MSVPERKLWKQLRDGRLKDLKFRRQHPIGPYTADFFCASLALVVELDGMMHDRVHDEQRDMYMRRLGLTVVRFPVSDFEKNPHSVLANIWKTAQAIMNQQNRSTVSPGANQRGDDGCKEPSAQTETPLNDPNHQDPSPGETPTSPRKRGEVEATHKIRRDLG